MMGKRGLLVDHTTIYWWVQRDAPELERRSRPSLKTTTDSWRVDKTSVKVKGLWMDLSRAGDSHGNTLEFHLSATRDAPAAKRFFAKALGACHAVAPHVITVEKNAASPKALLKGMENSKASFSNLRTASEEGSQYPNKPDGAQPLRLPQDSGGTRGNPLSCDRGDPSEPRKKKSPVGVTRAGMVYELFFTTLPQHAFTACDVVELYEAAGAFEPTLSDEDNEQDPDRWCSHSAWGQECWQTVSQ